MYLNQFDHLGEELHHWRLVRVLLTELESQLKCTILGLGQIIGGFSIGNPNKHAKIAHLKRSLMWSKDDGVPEHDVVFTGGS